MDPHHALRRYWDRDAATYDRVPEHASSGPAEAAAWNAALERVLPPSPARVLDIGAGTGFLSIATARLGHEVTALDISQVMLDRLVARAAAESLVITPVHGRADEPPEGPFQAVIERHVLWTLPDPGRALTAWRRVAPEGRLALFEGLWGDADPQERRRQRRRAIVSRLLRDPGHHRPYDPQLREALPFAHATHPDAVVTAIDSAGWRDVRIERLRDVEWTRLLGLPPARRRLGITPVFVISAR